MNFLIFLSVVMTAAWVYVLFIRPRLAARYPATWARIDAIEAALWQRSRQILISRLYWVGGILIGLHDWLAGNGLDATPVVNEIANYIPADYRGLALALFIFMTGAGFEWLRRVTTGPVGGDQQDGGR